MSYFSYASVVKGKKLPTFKSQDLRVAVRDKMREYLLPEEIIAIIFALVDSDQRKRIPYLVDSLKEKHSVWWNPSRRLIELCGERGALQPYHYDLWAIFPSYIPFKNKRIYQGYSSSDKEDIFNLHKFVFSPQQGCCGNCVAYRFPCLNCSDNKNCKEMWSLVDEPRVSYHVVHLDNNWPGWRERLELQL